MSTIKSLFIIAPLTKSAAFDRSRANAIYTGRDLIGPYQNILFYTISVAAKLSVD